MHKFQNLFLAVLSGLLLFVAWPVSPLTFIVFVAWIPLLWLESKVTSRKKFFGLVYITMFIWNVGTTWWIWNASIPGALSAFFANSLLMCLPWLGYKIAKKWLGPTMGYISLIAFWMCFEYIHLQDWGLSWPWLTLGNAFATQPAWVRWYSYTGVGGGSIWILLINILLYLHLKKNARGSTEKNYKAVLIAAGLLITPIIISILMRSTPPQEMTNKNIVIVQPNVDPYEKISTGTFDAQLQLLIRTTEKVIDSSTALVIWPETALYMQNRIEETTMKENFFLNPLWGFLQRYPNVSLFTGIESYRQVEKPTTYADEYNGQYFESYNGSVLMDSSGPQSFYHKSMLVPGVETLPWFLRFIDKWFEKFGGTTAGYAKQAERTVLEEKHGYRLAPAICYESIYGDFMRQYINNGANLICIITNDGWWKKTPGHRQHMQYARLRAIETGTWVARSANTGISCFIDPEGNVINARPYNVNAAIKYQVPVINTRKTFYVRNGDWLFKGMLVLSVILLGSAIAFRIRHKTRSGHRPV